jgi:hypothetical protein
MFQRIASKSWGDGPVTGRPPKYTTTACPKTYYSKRKPRYASAAGWRFPKNHLNRLKISQLCYVD